MPTLLPQFDRPNPQFHAVHGCGHDACCRTQQRHRGYLSIPNLLLHLGEGRNEPAQGIFWPLAGAYKGQGSVWQALGILAAIAHYQDGSRLNLV